jgi:hypothetical protein
MRFGLSLAMMGGAPAASGPTYSAEATALFARMTTPPSSGRKTTIDTLIVALKAAGVWTKMDGLIVSAAADSQAARLNWVQNLYNDTAINSPTFTADRGYTGDGATSYLDSGFDPTTAPSPKLTQNSAHIGVWCGTDINSNTQYDFGNINSRIDARGSAGLRVNGNSASGDTYVGWSVATSIGWSCWQRDNSANFDVVRNLDAPTNFVRSSVTPSALPFYSLATSTTGPAAINFSTRRLVLKHWGGAITDTERDAMYNAFAAYVSAVGA